MGVKEKFYSRRQWEKAVKTMISGVIAGLGFISIVLRNKLHDHFITKIVDLMVGWFSQTKPNGP